MTYSRGIPARDGGGNGLGTKELVVGSGGDSESEGAGGVGLGGAMTAVSRKRGWPLRVKRSEEKMGGVRRLG